MCPILCRVVDRVNFEPKYSKAAGEQYAVEWSGVDPSRLSRGGVEARGSSSAKSMVPSESIFLSSSFLDLEAEGAHGSLELAEFDGARLVGVKQV